MIKKKLEYRNHCTRNANIYTKASILSEDSELYFKIVTPTKTLAPDGVQFNTEISRENVLKSFSLEPLHKKCQFLQ